MSADLSGRDWKILEALYRLSPQAPRTVTYEDIVVTAWEFDKDEFGLRGYSELYPDSSDLHKRLYGPLKSKGFVASGPRGTKQFKLTATGWDQANARYGTRAQDGRAASTGRASRETLQELDHLERTEAARAYRRSAPEDILDTDFFAFYRTSVRQAPADFEGRLNAVDLALRDAERKAPERAGPLREVDNHLRDAFATTITVMTERKKREQ